MLGDAMRLVIQVDGPPVPKGRPRFSGHAFTPKRTRDFEAKVRDAMEAATVECDWPTDREYVVRIAVYRARKQGDAINYGCSVLDAGNKGVLWDDDRQVQTVEIRRFDDKDNPRTLVDVEVV